MNNVKVSSKQNHIDKHLPHCGVRTINDIYLVSFGVKCIWFLRRNCKISHGRKMYFTIIVIIY